MFFVIIVLIVIVAMLWLNWSSPGVIPMDMSEDIVDTNIPLAGVAVTMGVIPTHTPTSTPTSTPTHTTMPAKLSSSRQRIRKPRKTVSFSPEKMVRVYSKSTGDTIREEAQLNI